jgi:hypothetical protein
MFTELERGFCFSEVQEDCLSSLTLGVVHQIRRCLSLKIASHHLMLQLDRT